MDILKLLRAHWDRAAALAALLSGALAVILGYVGVSGTAFPAEQIPYIVSGAVGGIFLLGVAGTLYISADLRDEWRKLDDLDQRLDRLEVEWSAAAPTVEPAGSNGTARRTKAAASSGAAPRHGS